MLPSRPSHKENSFKPSTRLYSTLPSRTKYRRAPYPSRVHESDPEDDIDSKKQRTIRIPEPGGEMGHPGQSDTSQRSIVWSEARLDLVKDFVSQRIVNELDCSVDHLKQPALQVNAIHRATLDQFPWLTSYKDLQLVDTIARSIMKSRTAKSRAGVHHPGLTSSSQRDPRRSPSIIYVSDSPSDSHELASNNQNTPTDTSRYNIVYISDSDEEPESGTVVESSGLAEDAKQPNANERVLLLEQEAGVRSSKHEAQDDGITSDSEFEGAEFNANKIPKPEGEAGRPRRGGYNLEKVLGWSPKHFNRVKVRLRMMSFSLVIN
ncbi:hypothetical protein PM082_019950 [Marasmius tenuissimus]|nr:hypothetical protein PM082_019950 [Marasmius tenuissimus]